MTKKQDTKDNLENVSEQDEVRENIEQSAEELELEAEVEPSPEEKITFLEDQMMRLQAEMINTRKSAQNDLSLIHI